MPGVLSAPSSSPDGRAELAKPCCKLAGATVGCDRVFWAYSPPFNIQLKWVTGRTALLSLPPRPFLSSFTIFFSSAPSRGVYQTPPTLTPRALCLRVCEHVCCGSVSVCIGPEGRGCSAPKTADRLSPRAPQYCAIVVSTRAAVRFPSQESRDTGKDGEIGGKVDSRVSDNVRNVRLENLATNSGH